MPNEPRASQIETPHPQAAKESSREAETDRAIIERAQIAIKRSKDVLEGERRLNFADKLPR